MGRPRTKTTASLSVAGDIFRNCVSADQITKCELSGRTKTNLLALISMLLEVPTKFRLPWVT